MSDPRYLPGGITDAQERTIARWRGGDLEIEDHGWLMLTGHFEYGENGGSCQGWGYFMDPSFLMRFMAALGVRRLKDMDGKSCWVTRTREDILLVEPLHKKDGTPFDVRAWKDWMKRRGPSISASEYMTGVEP